MMGGRTSPPPVQLTAKAAKARLATPPPLKNVGAVAKSLPAIHGSASGSGDQQMHFHFGELPPVGAHGQVPLPVQPKPQSKPRARKWFWSRWKLPKFNVMGVALCLFLFFSATGFWSGPISTKFAESAASVSHDFAVLTATTTNLTVALADFAVTVSRSSAGLAHECWEGIDVQQATLTARGSRWIMHSAVIPSFFSSDLGRIVAPIPEHRVQELANVSAKVSSSVPDVAKTWACFIANRSFAEFTYRIVALPNDFVGV